jgi:hypothetical protein
MGRQTTVDGGVTNQAAALTYRTHVESEWTEPGAPDGSSPVAIETPCPVYTRFLSWIETYFVLLALSFKSGVMKPTVRG